MHSTSQHLNKPLHIIVGMSGGVDSSVSAYLLQREGHHVEAVFMKNWDADDTENFCPATKDIEDAQAVCDLLKIKLSVVNFANEYWEKVFAYFLEEYQAGRTPNPDVLCNKEIKFKAFLDYAKSQGADFIATGHYARKFVGEDTVYLGKGLDPTKDQSYFLCALTKEQISQSLFPVGNLYKSQVREIAECLGLITHNKKDSTGICFIGERKFKNFLQEFVPAKPGPIKNLDNEILAQHQGLMFHTIGQRQGLNIGGQKHHPEGAWYVADKNISENTLLVVQGGHHPALFKSKLTASHIHWINPEPKFFQHEPFELLAKTRYRQADQTCRVSYSGESSTYEVEFSTPQRAITPGQFIVFYEDNICLGGGIIEN